MNTVVLKMLCDSGWTDAEGSFIGRELLVDLNLDTGLVSPHFADEPETLNAYGPMPECGLLFEPAGLDDRSSLILRAAWDFTGKATGFHIACRSLSANRLLLKRWAQRQEALSLVQLCYSNDASLEVERRAA